MSPPAYDLAPLATILALGAILAAAPLGWVWWRHRDATSAQRLRALTWAALFLTFDLVLFGAFTRLTDSGLGCPDWPGCYGSVSPFGAATHIEAAQTAMPTGPVTHGKAWIEMIHRYLATGVGALITLLALLAWRAARRGEGRISPWWPTATFLWVCVQGAFGALTVTMKLYPAIVTLHLLGGIGLLVLLAAQARAQDPPAERLPSRLRAVLSALAVLTLVQIALGGWVSTNYAVLACRDFPTCQGAWWPAMDFAEGFNFKRELGASVAGGYLTFQALTAIHQAHRIGALVLLAAVAATAWLLWRSRSAFARRGAAVLAGLAFWQVATGLSNAVLGWPMAAALGHTAGASALALALTWMLVRPAAPQRRAASAPGRSPAAVSPGIAS